MSTSTATMTIGGEAVAADASFDVIDPASGTPFAVAPECSPEQLNRAFAAASGAFVDWRTDEAARREQILAAADALAVAADDIAPVLTREQGKPLAEATMEVHGAAAWLRYFAGLALDPVVIQDDEAAHVEVVRRPLGVVAAITPWNYPLLLAAWKLAPALVAGNTVVLKPSPYTPLSTLAAGDVLASVLPPGVINVVTGGDALGAQMTAHPVPRKISFTGSVATGKAVATAAADDLKRVTLELGGNDAAIVLDDADPAEVAVGLFRGAFANNGQVCSAVKRVYVPTKLRNALVEALVEQARAAVVGDGMDPRTTLGPLNNRAQLERVVELVGDATARGGAAATGGSRMSGEGYFFEPTILDGAVDGMRVVDEEQFGPVLPVIAYDDVEDAVAAANATHFGLSGSVWGSDVDRASAVAQRLECGTSWVNVHVALAPHQPFGGWKWSGLGVENGSWGLESFTELKVEHRPR